MANRKGTADRGPADTPTGPYVWQGCYPLCLRTWCAMTVVDPLDALMAGTAEELAELEAEQERQILAEMERRRGQPVRLRYWQLPFSECPLPRPWLFTGWKCFIVRADDTVEPDPDGEPH